MKWSQSLNEMKPGEKSLGNYIEFSQNSIQTIKNNEITYSDNDKVELLENYFNLTCQIRRILAPLMTNK